MMANGPRPDAIEASMNGSRRHEIAGQHAGPGAAQRGQNRRGHADRQRRPRAQHHAREHVAAERVGAKPVFRRHALAGAEEALLQRVMRHDPGAGNCQQDQQRHQQHAERGDGVAGDVGRDDPALLRVAAQAFGEIAHRPAIIAA
jgi:hypothetical protein